MDVKIDVVFIVLVLAMLFAGVVGRDAGMREVQDRVAQTECGRYHPDTGDFEWLDKRADTK